MTQQLDQQVLDRIIEQIVRVLDPEKIILFGSYARGEAGPDSDVDIAVIANTGRPRHDVLGAISWNLHDLHLAIDIILYSPERWRYFRQVWSSFPAIIEETGRTIYERTASQARTGAGVVG
jgi:uncharacterized protein